MLSITQARFVKNITFQMCSILKQNTNTCQKEQRFNTLPISPLRKRWNHYWGHKITKSPVEEHPVYSDLVTKMRLIPFHNFTFWLWMALSRHGDTKSISVKQILLKIVSQLSWGCWLSIAQWNIAFCVSKINYF